jgi:hypothetical protein
VTRDESHVSVGDLLALGYGRKQRLQNKGEVRIVRKAHKLRKGRSGQRIRKEGAK